MPKNISIKIYQENCHRWSRIDNYSFQFNRVGFIQTLGADVGAVMALACTTLILAYLEENLYEIIGEKIQQQYKKKNLLDYGKDN